MILCLVAFWTLFLWSLIAVKNFLPNLKSKGRVAWILDFSGLFVQGWFIPLFAAYGLTFAWSFLLPHAQSSWSISAPAAFFINFVGVDLLYYLNHRLFHTSKLWGLHAVHHTAPEMDIFVSARNSVFTSFFICYLWVNSFFAFVLQSPEAFVLAASLTAALDMWRHSQLQPRGRWAQALGVFLVLPSDHAWHHSATKHDINFGANLCIWDKIFGTFYRPGGVPERLGLPDGPSEADGVSLLWYPLSLKPRRAHNAARP